MESLPTDLKLKLDPLRTRFSSLKLVSTALDGKEVFINTKGVVMNNPQCYSEFQKQGEVDSVKLRWQVIRNLGTDLGCKRGTAWTTNSAAPQAEKSTDHPLINEIHTLNNIRFNMVDSIIAIINAQGEIAMKYTGSKNYDSDVDITANVIRFSNKFTVFETFYNSIKFIFNLTDAPMDYINFIADFLDINIYIANFQVFRDVCISGTASIKASSHPNEEMGLIECFPTDESRLYPYYRIKSLFNKYPNVKAQFDTLESKLENTVKSNVTYIDLVEQFYQNLCQLNVNCDSLRWNLFVAMNKSRDQYFTVASYVLVVLEAEINEKYEKDRSAEQAQKKEKPTTLGRLGRIRASQRLKATHDATISIESITHVSPAQVDKAISMSALNEFISKEDENHIEAAWDNIGMLYHVLNTSICQEPDWITKVAKYMIRILNWVKSEDENIDTAKANSKLLIIRKNEKLLSHDDLINNFIRVFIDLGTFRATANTIYLDQLDSYFLSKEEPRKAEVFKICLLFTATHFPMHPLVLGMENPNMKEVVGNMENRRKATIAFLLTTSVQKGGKMVKVSSHLRKVFEVPGKYKGGEALAYICKHRKKKEIYNTLQVEFGILTKNSTTKQDALLAANSLLLKGKWVKPKNRKKGY